MMTHVVLRYVNLITEHVAFRTLIAPGARVFFCANMRKEHFYTCQETNFSE